MPVKCGDISCRWRNSKLLSLLKLKVNGIWLVHFDKGFTVQNK